MPKEIWLMRHLPQKPPTSGNPLDWDPNASLAGSAFEIAARIREQLLAGIKFDTILHSHLIRTRLTVDLVLPADMRLTIPLVCREIGPEGMDTDWDFVSQMKKGTAAEAYELAPEILEREGNRIWRLMNNVVCPQLPSNGHALLVSHSPLVESAIASATALWPPRYNFGKGDIGVFTFESARLIDFGHLPAPVEG